MCLALVVRRPRDVVAEMLDVVYGLGLGRAVLPLGVLLDPLEQPRRLRLQLGSFINETED